MRTLTLNSAIITYPDKRVFSSTPSCVYITNLTIGKKVLFTFNGITVSRYADASGGIMFPLVGAFESFFKDIELNDVDYSGDETIQYNSGSKSIQKDKNVVVTITDTANLTFDIIYGAVQRAQIEGSVVEVYSYSDFPFSITQTSGTGFKCGEIIGTGFGKEILLTGKDVSKVEMVDGETTIKTYNVVRSSCASSGMYLRWLDLLGEYKYDLFTISQDDLSVKTVSTFNSYVNDLTPSDNGLIKGSLQTKSILGANSITGAGIFDENHVKHIDSLILSQNVCVYLNGLWVEVVKADMTRSRKRTDGNLELTVKITLPDFFTPQR